jgi:hypothetical protein
MPPAPRVLLAVAARRLAIAIAHVTALEARNRPSTHVP